MHTHVIPGLDDGSTSLEESIYMISSLGQQGIAKVYGTPHIQDDIYPNDPEFVRACYARLAQRPDLGNVTLDYAAEYTVDKSFLALIESNHEKLLCLGDRYILLGMSYLQESAVILETINKLITKGYRPILGNVERYIYYHNHLNRLTEIKDLGCLLQVGLLSCYGYYGSKERDIVRTIAARNLIDLIGTNTHCMRHVDAIARFTSRQDLSGYFVGRIKNEELFG